MKFEWDDSTKDKEEIDTDESDTNEKISSLKWLKEESNSKETITKA